MLKPGGHFVFNVWDEIGTNDFANIVHQSLATLFPNDPSAFMARTPHGYYDLEKLRGELRAAGFTDVSIEMIDHVSKAASPKVASVAASNDPRASISFSMGVPWQYATAATFGEAALLT